MGIAGHEAANLGLSLGPEAALAFPIGAFAAQFGDEPPVAQRFPSERAFSHAVLGDERFDLSQYGLLFHETALSRVITRRSSAFTGDYTKLRDSTRAPISPAMPDAPVLDIDKLKADMAAHVERTSARKFSLAITGGKNPDFYRNFVNNGQDKRMSADVFIGIVNALGRNPLEYVDGADPRLDLPNETVLTSAFAVLLNSLGIDPYQDERARKLAGQFPDVLRGVADLHSRATSAPGEAPESARPSSDEERPSA